MHAVCRNRLRTKNVKLHRPLAPKKEKTIPRDCCNSPRGMVTRLVAGSFRHGASKASSLNLYQAGSIDTHSQLD